jgi:rRNA small subunit pseudouridine methyltransferase Nep1
MNMNVGVVQLLHKLRIRSSDGGETLMKVIKNPITRHLPPGCRKYGTSVQGKLIDPHDLVPTLPQSEPIVFAIGSHAHGPAEVDWSETTFSFSQYALSASVATGRLLNAFERHWGIL